MIVDINDFNSNASYVFIQLFMDSMRKIAKKNTIESLRYTHPEGLIAKDVNGTFWKINVSAELQIPEELKSENTPDEEANGIYCVNCLCGIGENNSSKGLCKVCEYIERARA